MSAPETPQTSANPSFLVTSSSTPAPAPAVAPPLPSPSEFDILPDLHRLLTRLQLTATQPPDPSQPAATQDKDDSGPVEINQLQTKANQDIKQKIRKARDAVMKLPDIDRTCKDQQEEIDYLEERINQLKDMLHELGQTPAVATKREDEDNDMSLVG